MRTGRGNMSDTRIKRLPINLQTTSKNSSHKKAKIFGECVCVSGCFIGKGVWGGVVFQSPNQERQTRMYLYITRMLFVW